MVRDYYFRNADYKLTYDLWDKVEEGSIKNIYPYTNQADFIFNSAAFYEYNLYKKHLEVILKDALDDKEYCQRARMLMECISEFETLSDTAVPDNSIIKEFIG